MNNRQKRAEDWARDFIVRYTPDRLPNRNSLDRQERSDGHKLNNLHDAWAGRGSNLFYPTVQEILEEAGFTSLFTTRQHRAEAWARGFVRRYTPDRLPVCHSKADPLEARDAKRLVDLRCAKFGKIEKYSYYPSIEKIFADAGFEGILEDRQGRAELWARGFVRRYTLDRLPRWGASDSQEEYDYRRLNNFRSAKLGCGTNEYYLSVEKIFEEAGLGAALERQYHLVPSDRDYIPLL